MTASPPPTAAEETLDTRVASLMRDQFPPMDSVASAGTSPTERTVRDAPLDFTRLLYMQFISLDTQIAIADTKAQLIMAANTILVASLAFNSSAFTSVVLGSGGSLFQRMSVLFSLAMTITLVMSIFFALGSSRPSLRSSRRRNLFFFGHVTAMDEDDFYDQFMAMSMQDVKIAVLGQIHARSGIVANKYRQIRLSLIFLFAGLLLWIAARLTAAL